MTHSNAFGEQPIQPTIELDRATQAALGESVLHLTGDQAQPVHREDEPTTEHEAHERLMDSFDTLLGQQFWAINRTLEARGEQPIPPGSESRPRFDLAFSEVVGQAVQEGTFPLIMPRLHTMRSTNTSMVRIAPDIKATVGDAATFNNDHGVVSLSAAYSDQPTPEDRIMPDAALRQPQETQLGVSREDYVTALASFPTNGRATKPQFALTVDGYNSLRQQMDAEIDRINQAYPENPENPGKQSTPTS